MSRATAEAGVKRSVVERAYDIISERITSGHFAANERLTEARLTEEIGVGRGAVREVMNKLAADGLIELVPNRGAVVRAVTRKDMADFFQVRGLFESFAARRAAERINEPGSRELVLGLIDEIDELERNMDLKLFAEHDSHFHGGLMDLSGNEIMAAEWRRLRRSRFRIAFLHSLSEDEIRVSLKEHRTILLAILSGESEMAADLGWRHVRLTSGRVQRMSNQEFEAIFCPSSPGHNRKAV
ncbi:MAG: GntR family transcriptional regulator [Spongiibacteraceae bacterium]|jgi:DNA-binding GntR family transcriptional regulator|nr:GntR family transcriptional regulator [Spongiibacteraceae bacterium]